jgi:heparanase 1
MSASVSFDGSASIFTVEPHFLSYTIDTSDERAFFKRDLANPRLRWLAKQLSPAVLRVGGSGGDELYYDVPHAPGSTCPGTPFPKCKTTGKPPSHGEAERAGKAHCLNTSTWDNLNSFAADAEAQLVFGLNFFLNSSSDSVASLLRYTAQRNYSVFGYEFGNEQIKAPQTICRDRQAAQGAELSVELARLYPDERRRPRLIGPDAGGAVSAGYVQGLAKAGASLFAYTYHEYSLSRGLNGSSYIPPSQLMTRAKCEGKTKGLRLASKGLPSKIQLWAGEAGGTGGGGSPNVTNAFASGIWYLDSLGLYASTGTSVFCRQDLVGGFYQLLDDGCPFAGLDIRAPECAFHPPVPNPDYWAAILWKKSMG